ncbi:Zn(II)2Cys6 transcription factor domain-containing protein, partial [Aspergillus fijiensis CBS 313.89]
MLLPPAMDQPSMQYDLSPAPYGRACMNCSQAKCKCILSKDGGQCQRCQRLNKECRPSAFQRRQNLRKSAATKSGRLEKKLDDVVALLRARAAHASGSSAAADEYADLIEEQLNATTTPARPRPRTRTPRSISRRRPDVEIGIQNASNPRVRLQSPEPLEQTSGGLGSVAHLPEDAALELAPWQAEECLTAFLTQKLPYLPFIHFPSGTTARRLQRERPFTWLCVMAVASKSAKQRSALCDKVKEIVARKAVLDYGGRDLDLLLGILIFIAWSSQQVFRKLNLIMFSQLAIAVVYDLSLDKPSSLENSLLLCLHSSVDDGPPPLPVRSKEERRAVLGCYLLTSSIALFFKKASSLRWTPYLEECLETLSQHPDSPHDEVFIHQVRYQHVTEQLNHPDNSNFLQAPIPTYQHALTSYLQSAQTNFPPHTQQYKIIHLHNTHTTLTLTEPSLLLNTSPSPSPNPKPSQSQSQSQPSSTSQTATQPPTLNIPHLNHLSAALTATKLWLETFLTIPPAEYSGFPFTVFAQLARTLAALWRLSTLEDPLWDRGGVRRAVDILGVLDRVVGNLGQAAALARLEGGRGFFGNPGGREDLGHGDGEEEEEEVDEGEVFFQSVGKYESMRL